MDEHFGKKIHLLDSTVRKVCDHEFSTRMNDDLTGQQGRLLGFLSDHPGVSASEIATRFGLSKSTVSEKLRPLIEKGFITYSKSEKDGREKTISLTEKGLSRKKCSLEVLDGIEAQIKKGFTEAELNTLSEYIVRILENCEEVLK